jgi:multiple sugar transport system permease protein
MEMRDQRTGYLMVAPALIALAVLIAYPFLLSIYFSLSDKRVGLPGHFIGLENFEALSQDSVFQQTLFNTGLYTVVSVACKLVLGLTLALLLEKVVRGQRLLRGIILLPWVIPASLSTLAWRWMFDPSYSVLNWCLRVVGLGPGVPWLSDPWWARATVISVNVWRGLPFFAICLLAGLVSIPKEFYEAARVDGAGPRARFWYVTLPLLRPILGIVLLYSVIMTVSDFIIVHVLTRGGPLQSTHLFATLAYRIGLAGTRLGMGAAITLFLFPVLVVGAYVLLRIVRRGEEFA